MRRGREFYSKHYGKVIELHKKGIGMKEIAGQTGLSYSAVYHWVRGIRRPEAGNLNDFESFLQQHGPAAAAEIAERFPKHNELFLTAARRSIPIKRFAMKRKFGEYGTWYFLDGQEETLKKRITEMLEKYKEIKENIAKIIGEAPFLLKKKSSLQSNPRRP